MRRAVAKCGKPAADDPERQAKYPSLVVQLHDGVKEGQASGVQDRTRWRAGDHHGCPQGAPPATGEANTAAVVERHDLRCSAIAARTLG